MSVIETWLDIGTDRRAMTPQADDRTAHADGACPLCKAEPFVVAGKGMAIEGHDTYAADGFCLACRGKVGVLRARVSTLFGLAEDEAVLHGRPRVY